MKIIKSSTRFAMRYALQVSKFPHGLHAKQIIKDDSMSALCVII